MKKSLVALALFGAFATVAQAQSSVVIYGALDTNIQKVTGTVTSMGQSDNNKLGFKGVEDLGNGLKALFQLEMRYNIDTGAVESNTRPLFQGESRVGLQGDFGTVRLGRGKTALQDSSAAFEPWSGRGNAGAGFQADMQVAGFNTDPLNAYAKNRLPNGVFYNTPVFSGLQVNVSIGTKETGTVTTVAIPATATTLAVPATPIAAKTVPYSASATYNQGIVGAMLAYERNAIEDKVWSIAGSATPITGLKLMASYQRQNVAVVTAPDQKAWILGANYTMGASKFLAGYGQQKPETGVKTKRASVGYEYSLSNRTYVYAEASNKKVATSVNYYGVGVHHNF